MYNSAKCQLYMNTKIEPSEPQKMDKENSRMLVVGEENREEEEESPIRGDLLELILSWVPLIHLLSVCRVSKSWRRAAFSSLASYSNAVKPWLFAHTQSIYSFESSSSHAFDPRSNLWIQLHKPSIRHVKPLKSFGSDFLYVLSSVRLLLSNDPFYQTWTQFKAPNVCRDDPIVALCGARIVVAGSCWEFEDEQLAVEVYDPGSSTWRACQPMPEPLKNADAATWLSVAADQSQMLVTVKATGTAYSFDPCAGNWSGPYDLRPDPRAFFTTVGFAGEDLIVASLIGEAGHAESIRISKVDRGTMAACDPICDAPGVILEKLKGDKAALHRIGISPARDFVYMYNPWEPEELVFCDFSGSGEDCVWGSTRNVAWNMDVQIGGKMVFTCGRVEMEDMDVAMRSGLRAFLKFQY